MSGTGKSTALAELRRHGFEAVDTDEHGLTEWSDQEGGYVWREDRIDRTACAGPRSALFVSGTVSNQGRFYRDFDAVVLLSAPPDVLLQPDREQDDERLREDAELSATWSCADLAEVEPLLRATCTHEIDATQPVEAVVAEFDLDRQRRAQARQGGANVRSGVPLR